LTKEKKRKHHLTATEDPLYSELRDLNFSTVGKKLSLVAHRLDEDYKVSISFICVLGHLSWRSSDIMQKR
jgi:hypothetical protein